METITIHIDGISYEVPTTAGPHIVKAIEQRDRQIGELRTKADQAQARADTAEKGVSETQAKLDAAESPERVRTLVADRVALLDKARKVLGCEIKLDELSDKDIKLRCILATDKEFKADGKSEDYLNARFDLLPESVQKSGDGRQKVADAIRKDKADPDPYDSGAARARMAERNRDAWKEPLAHSKN